MTAVVLRPTSADVSFRALGTTCRVHVIGLDAAAQAARARHTILDYDRRLSRFRPDSELCALNADPRERVPASALLCDAVRAALWAAGFSGGLVDPTLLDALETAGYRTPWRGSDPLHTPASPRGSGTTVPAAKVANPRRFREGSDPVVVVGEGWVWRPVGVRLDLGGTGKGHVADLVAAGMRGRWLVDCGGDLRVGGAWEVETPGGTMEVADMAVATSSTLRRRWLRPDGTWAHHLLDPVTGEPVCSGIDEATAIAPTVLEAETRAKCAVLSGDAGWLG